MLLTKLQRNIQKVYIMENSKKEIVNELTEYRLKALDNDERELYINNNWGLTPDEAEYSDYPPELKKELLNEYFPKHDISSDFYDPLIKDVLSIELSEKGKSELADMYRNFTKMDVHISGHEAENAVEMSCCPCCHNKTLSERGQYFICPICDWEDDGIDEDHLSHCNGMKLSEAQSRFRKKGSIY